MNIAGSFAIGRFANANDGRIYSLSGIYGGFDIDRLLMFGTRNINYIFRTNFILERF